MKIFQRKPRPSRDNRPDWPHRWRHSLRLRLITVFLLLALAMAAVFLGGMKRALSIGWRDAALPLLSDYMDRLAGEIGAPPSIERAQALTARLPIAIRIDGPQVRWQSHPERIPGRFDRSGVSGPALALQGRGADWFTRSTADGHRISFGWGTLPWQRGPHLIGWVMLLVLLALIAIAYRYVRRLLRPLDDIRAGAERFGRGAFNEPIPLRRCDELGDLAARINTMAHDIEGMLDAKRALLLALSHELRSPLTRARLNAELLPVTPEGTGPGEGERAALLRDLSEMRDLIADLLESERLASPHAALQREPSDLVTLVQACVSEMGIEQALTLELAPNLPNLRLDRTRVRLLLRNLLDNALRYSEGAVQPAHVRVQAENGGVLLVVRDYGPGVASDQLPRLGEPFYRTDSARQRATGGVGLGMYLCRLVVQAHGGTFMVSNAEPGLEVQVLFNL